MRIASREDNAMNTVRLAPSFAAALSAALSFPAALEAQQAFAEDLLAVSFGGTAFVVDSRIGQGHAIGSTGATSHSSMARAGRLLYTTETA